MDFYQILKDELGEPTAYEALNEYIQFVTTAILEDGYSEQHHLLPRAMFPDYENCPENIFKLNYKNHVKAHELLAKAYPIRKFIRPLAFMMRSDKSKGDFSELWSLSIRNWWNEFRQTPRYETWRQSRSEFAKKQMLDGQAKSMSAKFYSHPDSRTMMSNHFKSLWADPQYKERIIESMIRERNSEAGKVRMKKAAKENWDSRSDADREAFRLKMNEINSSVEKRTDASEKIKTKWQDDEFKQKMSSRKPRGPDGSKLKEKWADPIWREMMLSKRKIK